jgi:hypothetical protein
MNPDEQIIIDRNRMRLGKYTGWAANLSDEEMYGLLWLLGEFGIRTSEYNLLNSIQEAGRARTGLLGALGFVHGHPLSQEQAMKAIRNAYKTSPLPQDLNQSSHD